MRQLDYPRIALHELLGQAAARWPDKTGLLFRDRRITFAEWDRQASQFANALLQLGTERGDRIALFTPNCPEYEIAFFGAARAGGAPTPLNPSYKEREVRHQLNDSGATVLVVHQSLYPVVDAVRGELTALRQVVVIGETAAAGAATWQDILSAQPDMRPDVGLQPEDLAALPYSSGTTGASKGVILTQRNLVSNAYQFVDCTQTSENDTLLVFLPLYHIYGVILMVMGVAGGATQILMERFDLAEMVRLIETERVTELFVVPPVMLALAGAPDLRPEQFGSLRFVKSAAAPLAPDVGRRVADRLHLRVIQAYGMTEASPLTHMVPLDQDGFENVGVVAPDTLCRIVDLETGERQLPPGEVGEVVISGPQVMAGYWKAPDATALALRDGWLYTGDVGRVDEEGRLYLVDRKKEMIKYKAFSIAPAELEAVLLEHPAVQDCAVVGQADDEAGEVPHAYVVLRPGEGTTAEELQAFVAERVAGYKQIRAIDMVEAIPRTPSGKILRRVLKKRAGARV